LDGHKEAQKDTKTFCEFSRLFVAKIPVGLFRLGPLRRLAVARTALSPERECQQSHSTHDDHVGHVEYAGVKRTNAKHKEVRDETVSGDPVDEIAHSTGRDQGEPGKGHSIQSAMTCQVTEQ
jgi:hypothetical protein